MKKSLVALALMGAFAGAHAQSSVTIYGTLDAGVNKLSCNGTAAACAAGNVNTATAIGKRDNNKLGFRGVEDLGNGLKALFHLEIRYEPDTGVIENTTRPLFQGQSRVGLQGGFGTVRLGRGLTPFQESITAFEPWSGIPSVAGYQTDLQVAGYTSDPLSPAGNSGNRFSNAVWYNTPDMGGFQLNVAVASKEANSGVAINGYGNAAFPQYAANAMASANPYSVSATFNKGIFGAMAAYERNAVETKFWSVAGSIKPMPELKLMASYQRQDQSHSVPLLTPVGLASTPGQETKAWILGVNYTMGPGKLLLGYGQKQPDNVVKTKQASIGYEYSLSTRTYVYLDLSNKKKPLVVTAKNDNTVNFYSVGVHHNF
ncbi:MAG: porin [Pseudomonadota bacterium]